MMVPESPNSLLSYRQSVEPSNVEIEDREFVFGKDIGFWLQLNASPNLAHGRLKILADGWVEVAFGVASNVDGALVVECSYPVNVGCVPSHVAVV